MKGIMNTCSSMSQIWKELSLPLRGLMQLLIFRFLDMTENLHLMLTREVAIT